MGSATRPQRSPAAQPSPAADENVVQRLRRRRQDAMRLGFHVRVEVLGDEQATWCEIAGKRVLFLDLTQTAAEQLHQLNEILASFENSLTSAQARAA